MENNTAPAATHKIPNYRFGDFVARFTKLNRKAKKLGCVPATYTVIGETTIRVPVPEGQYVSDYQGNSKKFYEIPAKEVAVSGTAPQVGNHQLLARIEYLGDVKSKLFHTVPGIEIKVDERFRDLHAGVCEHCNTNRYRIATFVVRNTITGEQKQIGRNCLADFIGGVSPEQIANQATWLKALGGFGDEEDPDRPHGYRDYFHDRIDTVAVLQLTSVYISQFGWVPKSQATEQFQSTASRVAEHFYPATEYTDLKALRHMAAVASEPVHVECAAKVIAWIKDELAPVAKSDYELNLCTLVVNDLTETRHLGIVCSAVSAYQRAMNRGIEYAKKRVDAAKSDYIGVAGDKFKDLEVSVQFVKSMESHYGPTTLVKFVDQKGNLLTWFASGDKRYTPGEKVTISGTIKGQKEYQEIKETQLTRVKVK